MINTSFLSDQCKEIVLGALLGEGSLKIHKPYKNARLAFRHSIRQKEYFFWKVNQLKEISSESYWWKQEKNSLGGEMLRYQSATSDALTKLFTLTHKNGKSTVRRKWLNMLTARSLAIWWMDDGSLVANGRRGVICTDSFSYEEQQLLARYLKVVWDINVAIGKITRVHNGTTREYYRLWIRSTEELRKLMKIILPYVQIPSMLPKVLLLYKDSQLQQRWISEVSSATNIPEIVIEHYLEEKKQGWKSFRK